CDVRSLFSCIMKPRPPRSPLFPYTTLFRSVHRSVLHFQLARLDPGQIENVVDDGQQGPSAFLDGFQVGLLLLIGNHHLQQFRIRSEEHTSELQSRENLVCRLLLEKKNKETL